MEDNLEDRCPVCGTQGKLWHKNPKTFRCPNCMSIFSQFGMVLETETDHINLWA